MTKQQLTKKELKAECEKVLKRRNFLGGIMKNGNLKRVLWIVSLVISFGIGSYRAGGKTMAITKDVESVTEDVVILKVNCRQNSDDIIEMKGKIDYIYKWVQAEQKK